MAIECHCHCVGVFDMYRTVGEGDEFLRTLQEVGIHLKLGRVYGQEDCLEMARLFEGKKRAYYGLLLNSAWSCVEESVFEFKNTYMMLMCAFLTIGEEPGRCGRGTVSLVRSHA